MKQTFEDYLKDIHAEDYHGTDDDMPEAFDTWLTELQTDDLLAFGQQFASKVYLEAKEEVMGKIAPNIQSLKDMLAEIHDTVIPPNPNEL